MHKWIASTVMAAGLVTGLSTAAYAGPYLGASWGGYQIDESQLDDNDDLWKAYVGGQVAGVFGVEASWVDFSRVRSGGSSFEADGWGVSAVFSVPLGDSSLFLKAGQFWWDSQSNLGGALGDRDGNDPFFGAGLKFGEVIALRLEWERYDVANIDLDTYTVGLQLGF